jgi:acetylornithine deacetylase
VEQGGPLIVRHVSYAEGRGNILVELPGADADAGCLSFVGMHLDVVPANPDTWCAAAGAQRCGSGADAALRGRRDFDPFTLTRDGDKLRGRGVTDCLGHVALVTQLLCALAKARPRLRRTLHAVFIANEENSSALGVGVDALLAAGLLERLKAGPVLWVDVADKKPCIGTGGIAAWTLRAHGKLFHSGLPQHGINAIELASAAVAELQRRFYKRWPAHAEEARYGFACASSMKPTQVTYPGGSINQIPGDCSMSGDIRLTPFYELAEVIKSVEDDVADINEHIEDLATLGPDSRFVLPDEGLRGRLALSWGAGTSRGLACDLASPGYAAMRDAFVAVTGECEPMAITGTLPCIRDLQDAGFDVQTLGFGLMRTCVARRRRGGARHEGSCATGAPRALTCALAF